MVSVTAVVLMQLCQGVSKLATMFFFFNLFKDLLLTVQMRSFARCVCVLTRVVTVRKFSHRLIDLMSHRL